MHDQEIALWNARCTYKFEHKFIGACHGIQIPYQCQQGIWGNVNLSGNRLGCRNLRRHSHLQTWWTHIFFFFLSPFLFFSSRLPWLVISLSACPHVPAREFFFIIVSVDLCWTERMTEKFLWETLGCVENLDASMKKSQVESFLFVCQSVSGAATITNREPITLYFYGMRDSCQRIVWDAATCCGTLHSQHDEPMTSFSRSPFLFFSSCVACLVVLPIGPSRACKWIIYHLCLRRLVLNKTHDREIALWNARMRIYFDANVDMPFLIRVTKSGTVFTA